MRSLSDTFADTVPIKKASPPVLAKVENLQSTKRCIFFFKIMMKNDNVL